MGEEGAGISAIRTAHARIASGQSDIVLVGGAFNGEREDMLLLFELGQYLAQGDPKPVWSRSGEDSGLSLGSMGIFLVLESEAHARKRGIKPYGELSAVAADHGKRDPGAASERLSTALAKMAESDSAASNPDGVLSGASGVEDITSEERDWLAANLPDAPARAVWHPCRTRCGNPLPSWHRVGGNLCRQRAVLSTARRNRGRQQWHTKQRSGDHCRALPG